MSAVDEPRKEEKERIFKVKKGNKNILLATGQKKKFWKSLKQIIQTEKSMPWGEDVVHYSAINSPPSFKPTKKYSDISGFLAPYTDPLSKLQFASAEEYQTIQNFPSDIVAGYLALRGAQTLI